MNFYARILGGGNFLRHTSVDGNRADYQTGYVFAGSLGYCWRRYGLRLEGEYAFRRNNIHKMHFYPEGTSREGRFQTSSYMANLLWDFPCTFWKIRPFVGAGMGYDFEQMKASSSRIDFRQTWKNFSWQVMAGLAYPIFCNTDLTVEYQFHQGGPHFYNNAIGIGLTYKFGYMK